MSSDTTALDLHSQFPDSTREHILSELSKGVPLVRICEAPDMPDRRTVARWARKDPQFAAAMRAAREAGAERLAFGGLEDLEAVDPDVKTGSARVQLAREKANHKRWLAERIAPQDWGSRLIHREGEVERGFVAVFENLGARRQSVGARNEDKPTS